MTTDASAFYLFASPTGTRDQSPSTVFYEVKGESMAKFLCALFSREYADANGRSAFHYETATSISVEEQVLLDEMLDVLAVYDDPDPGIYDPKPSPGTLLLAQYAVRARNWEELLRRRTEGSDRNGTPDIGDSVHKNSSPTNQLPEMSPEDRRNSGLILLMLLAQAYYKMLECTVSMASWVAALDIELNQSYLWTIGAITNLLKNHEDLKDFPSTFEPIFPDLYPSTIRDVEWDDMVAPDAERFLSSVQQYVNSKGIHDPEKNSPGWAFVELFRPSVNAAIERATAYNKRMHKHLQRGLASSTQAAGGSSQTDKNIEAVESFQSGVTQHKMATSVTEIENIMPTHQPNLKRLREIEELLDMEHDKYHEFRKEIAVSTGNEKILLKQRVKRELIPSLRQLEKEYAELLAAGVPTDAIPAAEAEVIIAQVIEAVTTVEEKNAPDVPLEMVRLLSDIRDKLSEPSKSASAKLKINLPIIPLIASYEMELDTEGVLTGVWTKARDLFKSLVKNRS